MKNLKKTKTLKDLKATETFTLKKGVECVPHSPLYVKNGKEAKNPFKHDKTVYISDLKKMAREQIKYIEQESYNELIKQYQIGIIREIFNLKVKKCKTKN